LVNPAGGFVTVAGGVAPVEAVAATGAHPTLKDAQKKPAASKRSCLIVPPAYTRFWRITAAKKGVTVIERRATEKPAPTTLSFFSVFIPSITVSPFFALVWVGGEDHEVYGGIKNRTPAQPGLKPRLCNVV
jgi:hypothetical protein